MTKPKGTGQLIDPRTGLIECRVCGKRWLANLRSPAIGYHYGSYECPNGCAEDDLKKGR